MADLDIVQRSDPADDEHRLQGAHVGESASAGWDRASLERPDTTSVG